MAVRRQKVQAECDPLSLLISQSPSSHELEKDDDENEEVIPVIKNKKVNTLLNTLAPEKPIEYEPPPPAPEQPKIHDIQKPVKVVIEEPPPPVVAPPASKPIPAPASKISQQLPPKQENPIVKAPSAPSSVFEAEEDIFLKKTSGGDTDDIFGAKGGELSELKFISPKEKLTSTKLDDNDSEDDEKLDDLAVGGMLEREELDFDMFGRSNVKQYQAQPVSKSKATLYQEDFSIQSEDEFNQMESILNESQSTKKYSSASTKSSKTVSSTDIDINSFDINAYISQQENDNNVSLFG